MSGLIQINDPGRRTRAKRLAFDPPCQCPAAMPVFETAKGSGVRCAIEARETRKDSVLTALEDPSTLEFYCFNLYTMCPTWAQEKLWIEGEREERQKSFSERQAEYAEMGIHIERSEQVDVTRYEMPE